MMMLHENTRSVLCHTSPWKEETVPRAEDKIESRSNMNQNQNQNRPIDGFGSSAQLGVLPATALLPD
jgi:hypothetical protein